MGTAPSQPACKWFCCGSQNANTDSFEEKEGPLHITVETRGVQAVAAHAVPPGPSADVANEAPSAVALPPETARPSRTRASDGRGRSSGSQEKSAEPTSSTAPPPDVPDVPDDAITRARSVPDLDSFRAGSRSNLMNAHNVFVRVSDSKADILYQFGFQVHGLPAKHIIQASCRSSTARSQPHADGLDQGEPSCLCPVPYPWGRSSVKQRLTLARLDFDAPSLTDMQDVYSSRKEANCLCVVHTVIVDPKPGELDFDQQLRRVTEWHESRRGIRAKWALILCRHEDARMPEESGQLFVETWEESMVLFEAVHQSVWKFGPVNLRDSEGLLGVFGKIASQRLLRRDLDESSSEEEYELNSYQTEKPDREGSRNLLNRAYNSEMPTPSSREWSHRSLRPVKQTKLGFVGKQLKSLRKVQEGVQQQVQEVQQGIIKFRRSFSGNTINSKPDTFGGNFPFEEWRPPT